MNEKMGREYGTKFVKSNFAEHLEMTAYDNNGSLTSRFYSGLPAKDGDWFYKFADVEGYFMCGFFYGLAVADQEIIGGVAYREIANAPTKREGIVKFHVLEQIHRELIEHIKCYLWKVIDDQRYWKEREG